MGTGSDDAAPDGYTYEDGPDCNEDCFGTAYIDDCGYCSEGSSGHVANSDIDVCNVCPDGTMGTGSDDAAPDGYTYEDGPDCNEDCFGTAYIDDCGYCSEGSSGHVANSDIDVCNVCPDGTMGTGSDDGAPEDYTYEDGPDCNLECFGTAFIDDCGYCVEGSTGIDELFADHGCGCDVAGPVTVCEDWDQDGHGAVGSDELYCEVLSLTLTSESQFAQVIPENWVQDCSDTYDDGEAVLHINGYDNTGTENGVAAIEYDSNVNIYGFQLTVTGVTLINGSTENADFMISVNPANGQVVGMSLTGGFYPEGFSELLTLTYEYQTLETELCLTNIIVAGAPGHSPEVQQSGCETINPPPFDCNQDPNGSAFEDDCDICSEGNTGHAANSDLDDCGVCFGGNADLDCHGDCFGAAYLDDCDICSEGNTGHPANSDIDCAGVCFGLSSLDICGVCDDNPLNDNETCLGCTDSEAMNFDQEALVDDGSCYYAGDFNEDGSTDVTDIILMVEVFLYDLETTEYQMITCDLSEDGSLDILDLVLIIDIILGDDGMARQELFKAEIELTGNRAVLTTEGDWAVMELCISGAVETVESTNFPGLMLFQNKSRMIVINLSEYLPETVNLFTFEDPVSIEVGQLYDLSGNEITAAVSALPEKIELSPAWPNPFNPATSIRIGLPRDLELKAAVFDVQGRMVADLSPTGSCSAGYNTITWHADQQATGIYFMRIHAYESGAIIHQDMQKILLVK